MAVYGRTPALLFICPARPRPSPHPYLIHTQPVLAHTHAHMRGPTRIALNTCTYLDVSGAFKQTPRIGIGVAVRVDVGNSEVHRGSGRGEYMGAESGGG